MIGMLFSSTVDNLLAVLCNFFYHVFLPIQTWRVVIGKGYENQYAWVRISDVPAWLGPKAMALAQPKPAPAFSKAEPSQSCHSQLGPGPAWLKLQLFAKKAIFFCIWHRKYSRTVHLL